MKNPFKTESVIAANRFGLGARPGDLVVIDSNPKAWLINQLNGPSQPAKLFESIDDSAQILAEVEKARALRRQEKQQGKNKSSGPDSYAKTVRKHYMQQVGTRYLSAASTDFPFHERLVHFWSNHFAVSADKQPITALAGSLENEAIRPNVSGRFADLLLAAEKHPAMLLYLDNQRSVGPNSVAGQKAAKRKPGKNIGLNENLAREILELHTLGVDGGYSQADVSGFARALTGWSVGTGRGRRQAGTPGRFYFREEIHDPGTVHILNTTYRQKGVRQAESVLHDLALHPSTARHIATKLARHFVADDPPLALVDRLTRVYLEGDGNLQHVYTALISASEPWQSVFGKYKTPEDFMVSTFRAFDYAPDNVRSVFAALEMMGQTPYRPGSPAGWPDTAAHWGGADGLYKRIEWGNRIAQQVGKRANPLELAALVLGPALGQHSHQSISRAESLEQGLVLFLVSPEFQRR